MKTERWQQVRAVLDEAISTRAAGRAAYLNKKCAGDAELRSEVDSLLRSHEQAGDEHTIHEDVHTQSSSQYVGLRERAESAAHAAGLRHPS